MPAVDAVRVEGLRELTLAFKAADKSLAKELRVSLRKAAEPVRADAERLATDTIPRIGVPWSRMRVGVTATSVYLAPRKRGSSFRARRRPNLADLLLNRSMIPALVENEPEVVEKIDEMLLTVGRVWEEV